MNEAELVFSEVLDCDRISLYLNGKASLDKDKSSLISSFLKRRINHEPIQYILGKTEFMGFEFKVSPGVLIPRPETEILVSEALKKIKDFNIKETGNCSVLDLGTGSGCIAISLAKAFRGLDITATDISASALYIAKLNAEEHNVGIKFFQSDLFANIGDCLYDLIVCNPPYIESSQINNLQPELKYEPRIALDGGDDGLYFYRPLINKAAKFLNKEGFLLLEIGFGQRECVKEIFKSSGQLKLIEFIKDYNGTYRVAVSQRI